MSHSVFWEKSSNSNCEPLDPFRGYVSYDEKFDTWKRFLQRYYPGKKAVVVAVEERTNRVFVKVQGSIELLVFDAVTKEFLIRCSGNAIKIQDGKVAEYSSYITNLSFLDGYDVIDIDGDYEYLEEVDPDNRNKHYDPSIYCDIKLASEDTERSYWLRFRFISTKDNRPCCNISVIGPMHYTIKRDSSLYSGNLPSDIVSRYKSAMLGMGSPTNEFGEIFMSNNCKVELKNWLQSQPLPCTFSKDKVLERFLNNYGHLKPKGQLHWRDFIPGMRSLYECDQDVLSDLLKLWDTTVECDPRA